MGSATFITAAGTLPFEKSVWLILITSSLQINLSPLPPLFQEQGFRVNISLMSDKEKTEKEEKTSSAYDPEEEITFEWAGRAEGMSFDD